MGEGKEPSVDAQNVRELRPGETSTAKKVRVNMGQPGPQGAQQDEKGKEDPLKGVHKKFNEAEETVQRIVEKVKKREEAVPKVTKTAEEIRKEREIEEELKAIKRRQEERRKQGKK